MRVLFLTYSIVGQSNYLRAESLARGLAEGGSEVTLVSAPGVERQSRSFDQEEVGTGVLRQVTVGKRGASRFRNSGLSTYEVIQRRLALAGAKFDLVHTFGHRPTVSWVGRFWLEDTGFPWWLIGATSLQMPALPMNEVLSAARRSGCSTAGWSRAPTAGRTLCR